MNLSIDSKFNQNTQMDSTDDDENLGWLISSSVFLGVVTIIFLFVLPILIKRRNRQPLKKRSPNLIILSTIGNMLFCLIMLLQQVLYYKCVQEAKNVPKDHQEYGMCQNQAVSDINCLIGLTLLSICEPMSILPYFLRTIRLYVIFKAQDYYFKNKQKPMNWFKYIKEGTLIKLCLLIIAILTLITVGLYLGYQFGGRNASIFIYTPSYNVQACYVEVSMSDDEKLLSIQQHGNISLIYIFFWHFIECMGLLICIQVLRNIKDDFNIRLELYLVFGVWFITSYLTTAIYLFSDNWRYLTFILIVRNFLVCMITALKPVYQTFQNNSYILLPPSVGSIESLDMVLIIPIASEYFYDYLERQVQDEEAPILFSLYADLRYYDKSCTEDDNEQDKYEKALAINQEYLNPGGKFFLNVNKDVKRAIDDKFLNLQQNLNEYLFIELLAYVLERLKEHFERFKRSSEFLQLEEEILRQEKLYEVLVDASIITN